MHWQNTLRAQVTIFFPHKVSVVRFFKRPVLCAVYSRIQVAVLGGFLSRTMDRKEQYKHTSASMEAQRSRRRGQEAELRKNKRDKILSSKRVRFSEAGELDEDFTTDQVRELAMAIRKSDSSILNSLRNLRKAFAQGSELISAFLGVEGSLRAMIGHLTGKNAQIQLEASWCITNLSAGTHEDTLKVLKASAPYLITYLSGQNIALQDQCAWALGNMSGDSQECREILQAQGIVVPMVNLLKVYYVLNRSNYRIEGHIF